jgi:hypothetical protein
LYFDCLISIPALFDHYSPKKKKRSAYFSFYHEEHTAFVSILFFSKISLDTLLIRQCPDRLESLCIKHAQVTVSLGDSQVLRHFKTLKTVFGRIDDGVPKFLSQQCPHLLELVFYLTVFSFTCINLPSHDLDLLNIDYPSSKKLFVNVNLDGHVWLYCTAFPEDYSIRDDSMFYSGVKPVQPKNLGNERVLDVVCRSIRTSVLHNRLAV